MPGFDFCGATYQARTINADGEDCINLFPESVESGNGASRSAKWALYRVPGRQFFCTLNDSPIACVVASNLQFSAFDVTPVYFAVSGSTLYSIAVHYDGTSFTGVPTTIGTVDQKGGLPSGALFPAQIIVLNPNLLFVVANGKAFLASYGSPNINVFEHTAGAGYAIGDTGIILTGNGLDSRYTIDSVTVGVTGAIDDSGWASGGSGYVVGDTGTITGGGGTGATFEIVSVLAGGSVDIFGYRLTNVGSGYAVTSNAVTSSSGAGTGFTINIIDVSNAPAGAVLTFTPTPGSGYAIGNNIPTQPSGKQPGAGDGNFTVDITSVGAPVWNVARIPIPDGTAPDDNYIQTATFMDGYVIVSLAGNEPDPQRRQFFISGLTDPSTWNPLDVGEKEGNPDPNVAVFATQEILFVLGMTTTELWLDNPNGPAFPFQRMQGGGLINQGLASPWLITAMNGGLQWIGNDSSGTLVAWQMKGQTPQRISNHAVEYRWRNYDVTGASAYGYQENGHYFFVAHFPIPDMTWVADLSTLGPDGKPCWHKRLQWDGFNWHADIGRYHAWSFPVAHVVGDYRNGNLYIQSVDVGGDNCADIRWVRITPHIFDEQRRFLSSRLRLYMETGTTSTAPVINLRISNDGGYTWGPYLAVTAGALGNFNFVVEWLRLGISRNRVYEISGTDSVTKALVDAFLEALPTVTR